MTKRLLIALLAFVSCLGLNAQTNPPDAFVYQGLAKNPGTGGIATNTKVRLKVQVLQGGPKGPMVFEEHHNTTTNADGIFSVLVGRGTKLSVTTYSSLYDIPWSQDSFYFSLSMSIAMRFPPNSYSPYLPIGTQQFFSVPYAMFAKEAQSVLDTLSIAAGGNYRFLQLGSQKPVVFYVGDGDTSALNELQELVRLGGRMGLKTTSGEIVYSVTLPDSSATNELQKLTQSGNIITLSQGGGSVTIVDNDNQTLAISGQTLMINGGNSVTLPDKDQQILSLSGNTVSISNGNSITLNPNDADADPNNELQTISKSGSTITLNKSGGSITDSDNQNLSVSGSSLTISSGNSVTLPDGSSTNELQTLGQTSGKGTITLSPGGGLVTLPDSSASNEIQNLSLSGASLSISSGNSVTLPDASSSNEIQTLSISGNTISLSQSGGSVTVPDSDDQTLSISGSTLSISNGNSVTINTNDSDADPSNEIQTISKSGSTISLSQNGGSVTDSDGQTLNLSGNTLSISGGNSVTLNPNDADSDASNEIQTLSISGNTISLSQSGGSVTVPDSDDQTLSISGNTLSISGGNSVTVNPNDADADSTNEIQTLNLNGDTLSISNGNFIVLKNLFSSNNYNSNSNLVDTIVQHTGLPNGSISTGATSKTETYEFDSCIIEAAGKTTTIDIALQTTSAGSTANLIFEIFGPDGKVVNNVFFVYEQGTYDPNMAKLGYSNSLTLNQKVTINGSGSSSKTEKHYIKFYFVPQLTGTYKLKTTLNVLGTASNNAFINYSAIKPIWQFQLLKRSSPNAITVDNTKSINGSKTDLFFGDIMTSGSFLYAVKDSIYMLENQKIILYTKKDSAKTLLSISYSNSNDVLMNRKYIYVNSNGVKKIFHLDTGEIKDKQNFNVSLASIYIGFDVYTSTIDPYGNVIRLEKGGTCCNRVGNITYYNLKKDKVYTITNPSNNNGRHFYRPQIINDTLILIANSIWKISSDTIIYTGKSVSSTYNSTYGVFYVPLVISEDKIITETSNELKVYHVNTNTYSSICKCSGAPNGGPTCKIKGVSDGKVLMEKYIDDSYSPDNYTYWIDVQNEYMVKHSDIPTGNPKPIDRMHPAGVMLTNGTDGNYPNVNWSIPQSGVTILNR